LLRRLLARPAVWLAIVSGRRLAHIEQLAPLEGLWLAGSYGLEFRTPEGKALNRLDYSIVRSSLTPVKPAWETLLVGRKGFYLEDKGWTLAIHAREADEGDAKPVLAAARAPAEELAAGGEFRVLGGDRFLEIAPVLASKRHAVDYLLSQDPLPGAFPLYLGDDDKDEEAFAVVQERGGAALKVTADDSGQGTADGRLDSPAAVRRWLGRLAEAREKRPAV
jgi:trehalose 6-phosphate phosphatase